MVCSTEGRSAACCNKPPSRDRYFPYVLRRFPWDIFFDYTSAVARRALARLATRGSRVRLVRWSGTSHYAHRC